LIKNVKILTGFNYRTYIVSPDGDNYVNPQSFNNLSKATADFTYTNYGGFISASKTLFDEKLKINASFRVDKSQYFSVKFNPRVAITFSPTSQDNFRISFQNGYRFPTLFEGYAGSF
jgi:outer membrane receptor protein involved in Fe transport